MAILDPRLIPFIEMLTELGLDWLAFELIEGVRRGQEPVETEAALALARQRVRTRDPEKFTHIPGDSVEGEPLLGDVQLEWTVRYVAERLNATLTEMSKSIDALDAIVASGRLGQTETTEASADLVLLDVEHERRSSRTQVEEARAQLPKLRHSLDNWLASTRSDHDQ